MSFIYLSFPVLVQWEELIWKSVFPDVSKNHIISHNKCSVSHRWSASRLPMCMELSQLNHQCKRLTLFLLWVSFVTVAVSPSALFHIVKVIWSRVLKCHKSEWKIMWILFGANGLAESKVVMSEGGSLGYFMRLWKSWRIRSCDKTGTVNKTECLATANKPQRRNKTSCLGHFKEMWETGIIMAMRILWEYLQRHRERKQLFFSLRVETADQTYGLRTVAIY